jgi:hypothetical protein
MCFSSTVTVRPTVSKMRCASSICAGGSQSGPRHSARRSRAQRRGRVGHGADHADLHLRRFLNGFVSSPTGGKGDQRLIRRQSAGSNLGNQVRHLEGLHAEQDQVGLPRRLQVVRCSHPRPIALLSASARSAWADRGVNLIRRKQVLLQKGLQQNAAHFARAQNGHADRGQLRGCIWDFDSDIGHRDFLLLQGRLPAICWSSLGFRIPFPCEFCRSWWYWNQAHHQSRPPGGQGWRPKQPCN